MTFYLVAWVTWSCTSGWLGFLNGKVPPKLRPLVCEEGSDARTFDRRLDADALVDQLGAGARPRIWQYKGLRREELPTTFKPRR